jgi:hypothetical protein
VKTSYEIRPDVAAGLVRIKVSGFFRPEEVVPFMLAVRDAILALKRPPGEHLTLMDMAGVSLHTQEVVDLFGRQLGPPELIPRRLAVVVSGSLHRMQVRRMFPQLQMTFFDDATEAERWLLEA